MSEPEFRAEFRWQPREPNWADLDELLPYRQHCLFCSSDAAAWAHLLGPEAEYGDEGERMTLPRFVFLCAACETLLERGEYEQLASLFERDSGADDGWVTFEAFQRGNRGSRAWTKPGSPRILAIEWGRIEVEGLGELKDAKLLPGGGRTWDWNETGTRHRPGAQVADVEELLAAGATTVVLSRGMDLVLQVPAETVADLERRGVTVHVAETREAVRLYNELAATTPVGGLFHSTC
ncbi:MAG: Mth938-like domain-containing protein [Sporichthyaceae bacterium]